MGKRRFPELGDSRERGKEREREGGGEERERAFIDEEMMISITREYKLFSWGGGGCVAQRSKEAPGLNPGSLYCLVCGQY